jgi:RNA polymerase sigma factor (sigma-70 family)
MPAHGRPGQVGEGLLRGSAPTALRQRSAEDLLGEFSRAGGEEAFGEVVRRYAAMVFAVCLKVTGNAHDAEDATQATFLNLAVQLKSGKPVHRLGPWLQQVARRAALDVRRSRKRRETHEQKHGERKKHEAASLLREHGRNGHPPNGSHNGHPGHNLPGAADIDLEKLNSVLGEELNRLPPKYRLPLMSLYFGRMERDEIAKELGLTVGTLGVRIHRARQMLARRLSERGVAPAERLLSGNILPLAISAVAGTNFFEQTAAAAAKVALGHDIAAVTTANVLAALKGTALATALAKLKTTAAVAIILCATSAVTAVAGAAVHWDVLQSHLPDSVRQMIDWARSPLRVPVPRPSAPSVPVPIASAPHATVDPGPRVAIAASTWPQRVAPPMPVVADPSVPIRPGGTTQFPAILATEPPRVTPPATPAPPAARVVPVPPLANRVAPRLPLPRRLSAAPPPPAAVRSDAGPRGPTPPPAAPATVRALPNLVLGDGPGMKRSERVPRGALVVESPGAAAGPSVDVGGGGTLGLGDGTGGGTVIQPLAGHSPAWDRHPFNSPAPPASFAVRSGGSRPGMVSGFGGSVGDGGSLLNDGRVVADGGGAYRSLVFAGYGTFQNTADNPPGGRNGWFARNGGRLVLPKIPIAPGTHTYTWGESADDPTIDLVNSVRVTLHDARAPGKLDISLLDKTRPEVPALPAGHTFIGVWSFDAGVTGASGADLTVRYDDRLAASLGLNEGALKLWRYDGSQWIRINDGSFSRDTQNNLLSGHAEALSFFAVSAPEPSSACLALLGGMALLRRRRGAA